MKLVGRGSLADAIADALGARGLPVSREEPGGPGGRLVWVAPDPPEGAPDAAGGLRRLGDALLFGGEGVVVAVVRSFTSVRGSAAFPKASAAGGAVLAEARTLAARCVGSDARVSVLAVGLLDIPTDDRLLDALRGPMPADGWVAARQGRRIAAAEVAAALDFLLSERAAILNGAVLTADSTLSTRL